MVDRLRFLVFVLMLQVSCTAAALGIRVSDATALDDDCACVHFTPARWSLRPRRWMYILDCLLSVEPLFGARIM